MNNWIGRTGQSWKLWVALFMAILACISFSLLTRINSLYISYLAMVFSLGAFIAFVTIRCPFCKKSVSWFYMKNRLFNNWFQSFFRISNCPICSRKI